MLRTDIPVSWASCSTVSSRLAVRSRGWHGLSAISAIYLKHVTSFEVTSYEVTIELDPKGSHEPSTALLAQAAEPAGGAALGQIVIATAAATLLTAALLVLGFGHRSGRVKSCWALAGLRRSASPACPAGRRCPRASPPSRCSPRVFGMYWDISLHIDDGRDAGPLANPAHYFILAGLFGIFTAGFFAMVLPQGAAQRRPPSASAATGTRRSAAC